MTNFILVPGAWHGAWCYHRLISLLKQQGHDVITIDLYDIDKDLRKIGLKVYIDYVSASIKDESIIVGHSMAGIILSSLENPNIQALVYLAAFMLEDNQALIDISNKWPSSYMKLNFSNDFRLCSVSAEMVEQAFYNNCKTEDIVFAKLRLKEQPYKIFNSKITLSNNYHKFNKYYIKCESDHAILPEAQQAMIINQSLKEIYSIHTDHSPFFSFPEDLANILNEIAKS